MNELHPRHRRTLVVGHTIVAAFVLSAALSLGATQATLYVSPQGATTIYPDEMTALDIDINAGVPINALDVTVTFPSDMLEIVGTGKQRSFLDLWPHDEMHPAEAGVGQVHFTAGTVRKGGLVGTSTAITLSVRAKKPGTAELAFKDTQVIASDGKGSVVLHDTRPFTLTIVEKTAAVPAAGGAASGGARPSPDVDGDGRVTIIDASIFLVKMLLPTDHRYDFNKDGSVGIPDLSVLLSQMRM